MNLDLRKITKSNIFWWSLWIVLPASTYALEINPGGYEVWMYLTIPPIGGFVGWITNVIALKMTFYPVEFLGVPFLLIKNQPFGLFGWQGIIPCKAGKMAGIAVDLMVGKLIDVKKVFQRLDPNKFAEVLEPGMKLTMKTIVDDVAEHKMPSVWDDVPDFVKDEFYRNVMNLVPELFKSLLEDVQDNIYEVFDIRDFAIRKMTMDKKLTNDMFLKCGRKEFKFIEYSGFIFGFLFGVIQALIWLFYDEDWVLPVAGFIVGFATNWLALKMIFEPVEPVYIGGFKIQGLFLKRQDEVAEEFASMSAEKIFTAEAMWNEILFGPLSKNFDRYVRKHSRIVLEKTLNGMDQPIKLYLSDHGFKTVQDRIADNTISEIPNFIHLGYEFTEKSLDIQDEINVKLKDLPSAEFEGVLHPVFEEDEIKLILVGALLGTAVGFFQLYVVFG